MKFKSIKVRECTVSSLVLVSTVLLGVSGDNDIEIYSTIEQAALQKFRPLVKDVLYRDYMSEDYYLMKFLKAKHLDPPQAAEMLRKAHEWRRSNNIDTIVERDHSEMTKRLPYRSDGFDRKGRPLVEIEFGKWDIRKIVLLGRRDAFNEHADLIFEELESRARKTGRKNVTRVGFLMNFHGYNPRQHACLTCIPALLKTATDVDAYFPEMVGASYFVNTPKAFESIFALIQSVMSESLQKAIKIYGLDKEEWQRELDKHIAPDQRSVTFGGTRV